MDTVTYALSRKYTDESLKGVGALKGSPCEIKSVVHRDGQNIITFSWKTIDDEERIQEVIVEDGTPIYVWTPGNTYKYGDLVIYESAFYRCIIENNDVIFDDTKWNEIGSPDGNYDIVQNATFLPNRFTAADRKMYYSIADKFFWLWDGTSWVQQIPEIPSITMEQIDALFD